MSVRCGGSRPDYCEMTSPCTPVTLSAPPDVVLDFWHLTPCTKREFTLGLVGCPGSPSSIFWPHLSQLLIPQHAAEQSVPDPSRSPEEPPSIPGATSLFPLIKVSLCRTPLGLIYLIRFVLFPQSKPHGSLLPPVIKGSKSGPGPA